METAEKGNPGKFVTVRNFAVKRDVYTILAKQASIRGVAVTQLCRWILENWGTIGDPIIPERISAQLEKDAELLGISTHQLNSKILKDWYSNNEITKILDPIESEEQEKNNVERINNLWEKILKRQLDTK